MPEKKSISKVKKKVLKNIKEKELIIKTKPEWVKSSLVNKAKYQKNTLTRLRKTMIFGRLREKELPGLNHTKKLKT